MPSFAQSTLNRWKSLWNIFAPTTVKKRGDIKGSAVSAGYGHELSREYRLDIPEVPLRPTLGSLEYSKDLLEMIEWSPEVRSALSFLSRDPFMERNGRIGSWTVAETLEDDTKVNPKILAIASELKNRRYGKQLVLGGLRLQEAARQSLGLGDSFLQLSLEKEGITRNRMCISRSLYMPPMSMFVKEDEFGDECGYCQKLGDGTEVDFSPLKILHFSYEKRRLYGESIFFQSIPSWRKLKRTSPATEKAVIQAGVAPWVHTMAPDTTEKQRELYQRKHQAERQNGFLSDMYLPNGAKFAKAEGNVNGITETVNYEQKLLRRMIPLGIPPYFFSGVSNEQQKAREISGQPAMLYSRTIASIRSLLGEQIRWALDIEIVLAFGFDFLMENPYDIVWPHWDVLPPEQMPKAQKEEQETSQSKTTDNDADKSERFLRAA